MLVQAIADCAAAGRSARKDPFAAAVVVWVAIHGLATLRASTPDSFPSLDQEQLLTAITEGLARVRPDPPAPSIPAGVTARVPRRHRGPAQSRLVRISGIRRIGAPSTAPARRPATDDQTARWTETNSHNTGAGVPISASSWKYPRTRGSRSDVANASALSHCA